MGQYVDAAGLRTYYEDFGTGRPLLLLHPGLSSAESWAGQTAALAARYHVLVPERRGHGRTPDVEGPITVAAMAEDTIAFMEALGLTSAPLIGWSDGALVAAARLRPDLVSKLVVIGQYFANDGAQPEVLDLLAHPEALASMLRAPYAAFSPDGPEHFDIVFDKLCELGRTDPGYGPKELLEIRCPTLVMQGDRDVVTVEHSAAIAAGLPDAQLAVVPGATHALPVEKPDLVNRLILDFLG